MSLKVNKTGISICMVLGFFVYIIYQIFPVFHPTVYVEWTTGRNGIRYILYWDSMWQYEDFGLGFGSEHFRNCAVKNCFATKDRSLLPLEEYDALVFHGVQYYELPKNNPPIRNPNQVYIYFNLESPFNTPSHLRFSYGFFNWTMSYR